MCRNALFLLIDQIISRYVYVDAYFLDAEECRYERVQVASVE